MSNDDVIERINDFLKSAEWKHTVSTFIENHCHFFTHDDGNDIDVNMYEIYKNFCDIVDGLLGMSLQEIGSSEEEFVDMLADKMRQPDVGPRDKASKFFFFIFIYIYRYHIYIINIYIITNNNNNNNNNI